MRAALIALMLLVAAPAFAQAPRVVEIDSRGQQVRALLLLPPAPVGSVILLAGGHGRLDISTDGRLGWGGGNQLVRTRASYAAAGFATLVPDIAPDLKGTNGYRFAQPHGEDLGQLVRYMRAIRTPVVIVGTSRGAVSGGAALAHASGDGRPDAMVLTAAMLMPVGNQPSFVQAIGRDPGRARLPMLVVGHRKDTCAYTLPESIDRFRSWHGGAVDVVLLDGPEGTGDVCDARSAHGFAGIDEVVVQTVTDWIRKLPAR